MKLTIIRHLPTNINPGPNGFTTGFYKNFREDLMAIFFKLFNITEKKEYPQTHSWKLVLLVLYYNTICTVLQNQSRSNSKRPISLMETEEKSSRDNS